MVENWGDDVPHGKVTDFYGAVQAKEGETIVFSWFEYPDKATRDAAGQKMMNDPRMKDMMGQAMPFDGKRMIYGGFESIVDERADGATGYVDGYLLPVPEGKKEAYRAMAQKAAGKFKDYGAVRVVEAWGDDVPEGKVTDYQRAVKAEDGEGIVYSYVEWPDKETRDAGWAEDDGGSATCSRTATCRSTASACSGAASAPIIDGLKGSREPWLINSSGTS